MYRLASEHSSVREAWEIVSADFSVGEAAVVGSKLGFYPDGAVDTELATFIYKAKRIEATCDNSLTYAAGDSVYDAGTPTGSVNKTSSAGRRLIGYALKAYPVGTETIEIEDFDGLRAVV